MRKIAFVTLITGIIPVFAADQSVPPQPKMENNVWTTSEKRWEHQQQMMNAQSPEERQEYRAAHRMHGQPYAQTAPKTYGYNPPNYYYGGGNAPYFWNWQSGYAYGPGYSYNYGYNNTPYAPQGYNYGYGNSWYCSHPNCPRAMNPASGEKPGDCLAKP